MNRQRAATAILLAGVFLAAALVRILASTGDLWFDEIWTLMMVLDLASPLEVFTRLHHDNNHYLNSTFLYFMGPTRPLLLYRIPSLAAGMGTMALAVAIARRRGWIEAGIAALLFGASFPLVLYASEVRGYAAATFALLAAYICLQRLLVERKRGLLVLFWLTCMLALLSHLTCLFVLASFWIWSAIALLRPGRKPVAWLREITILHGVPLLALAALYVIDLRHARSGGGPGEDLFTILSVSLAQLLPLPSGFFPYAPLAAAAVALCGFSAVLRWRNGNLEWIFDVGVLVIGPLSFVIATSILGAQPVAMRHFHGSFVFWLLGIVYGLGWLARRGAWGAGTVAALIAAMMIGNAQSLKPLLEYGRGGYQKALLDLAERYDDEPITVGSSNDSRNGTLVNFYLYRLELEDRIQYLERRQWSASEPDWFIYNSFLNVSAPAAYLESRGLYFKHVRGYPSTPFSGWNWHLYERVPLRHRDQNPSKE